MDFDFSDRIKILDIFNSFRSDFALGKFQGVEKKMQIFRWSDTLEKHLLTSKNVIRKKLWENENICYKIRPKLCN